MKDQLASVRGSKRLARLLAIHQRMAFQPGFEYAQGTAQALIRSTAYCTRDFYVNLVGQPIASRGSLAATYLTNRINRLAIGRAFSRCDESDKKYFAQNMAVRHPMDARYKPASAEPQKTFLQKFRELPLIPESFKYERAIGIEIECFGPTLNEALLPHWARRAYDGSIRADHGEAAEFRVLVPRTLLEVRLHRLCSLLSSHRVNKSCGLHVHLDARSWGKDEAKKRAKRLHKWLGLLAELVPASRRENEYCRSAWSETCRYRRVNFTSYSKHRTIEVRMHSGTVDFNKIISWVRLLEVLMVCPPPSKAGSCLEALAKLPLTDFDRSYWLNRHRALNPTQYTGGMVATTENE